jgi:hypothetical protein
MKRRTWCLAPAAGLVWLCGAAASSAQTCTLVPDDGNPSQKILRCGSTLTIRSAKGTTYHLTGQRGGQQPEGARLDSGALLIEFTPSEAHRNFQILTPHATAAVRGTKWATEVASGQTSTLVLSGAVEVARRDRKSSATLGPGEGADVTRASGPVVVKRWGEPRVRKLLARFGQ